MSGLAGLVRINLQRGRRAALLSAAGIGVGVASLVFFLAMGEGVGRWIREGVFPQDASRVEVVPPKVALGFLGKARLDDEALERLRHLPGVEAAYRRMEIRVPAVSRYDGAFFGQRLRMGLEIVGEGVDAGLLDLPEERWRAPAPGEALPVVVSSRLLEIYNKSFAKARGLPALTPQLLIGFEFPVEFGRSYVGGPGEGRSWREAARLESFSPQAMLQGITLPLDVAREINRHFGKDDSSYSAVVLQARSPDHVPALVEAVRALGFEVDEGERQLAQRLGAAVAVIAGTLALLGLFIVGLAGVNIALALGAQVRGRSREIGVMRALGATPGDIARIVLGEALVIGLGGALLGLAAAWGAAWLVDWAAASHLPDFPFKPSTFFAFSPWLLLLGPGIGVGAALLGAWPPARRAARLDPSRAMVEPL